MDSRPTLVTGSLRVEGTGRAGADVLVFGEEPDARPRLLAAGVTDARGAFALEPAADGLPDRATVIAKLKGDPVGVLTGEIELPRSAPLELDASGPFFSITGTIESDVGFPEELMVSLDPVRPAGVPQALVPFLNQRAAGVFDGRYDTRRLTERSFALRVQGGAWKLGGESIDHDRPNVPAPGFRNYVVAAARSEPDGAALPGSPHGGFELPVDGDRRVTLVLRELRDEEL